jgi:hypothetical protein
MGFGNIDRRLCLRIARIMRFVGFFHLFILIRRRCILGRFIGRLVARNVWSGGYLWKS